ncbi:radical SAM superfamily protein, partial [Vibrio parahaemolyticus V-223/04]
CRI